jgi:hypothetical protein
MLASAGDGAGTTAAAGAGITTDLVAAAIDTARFFLNADASSIRATA